jgi:hypothetical protein
MTQAKDLLEQIRGADRALAAVHISAGASHRVRSAIRDRAALPRARSRANFFYPFALVATVAALVFVLPRRSAPPLGQAVSASSGCVTTAAGDAVALNGSCMLTLSTMQIETTGTTTLAETADGVRLLKGTATFRVRHVPDGHAPVRVRVSGGVIEVIGTKFLVEQKEGGGSIQLVEGTIRFVFASGQKTILHAGEHLDWTDQATTPAPSGSAARTRPDDVPTPVETRSLGTLPVPDVDPTDPFYEQHPSLREARDRFDAVGREAPYTEAERLREKLEPASFELGAALESSHADSAQACGHWRWHLKRFPDGIYNGDIEARMRKLGCPR